MAPSAGRDPTRHRTLFTTTRHRRAVVVAVLVSVLMTASPASGVLAMLPGSALATPARSVATVERVAAPPPSALPSAPLDTYAAAGPAVQALLPSDAVPEPGAVLEPGALLASTARSSATRLIAVAEPSATLAATPQPARTRVVPAAKSPTRLWAQLRRGLTVRGTATWYPATRGYAGIAHVAMPGARYVPRGSGSLRARVCADGRCTIVRVVDACACLAGTPRARVADLSLETLHRLGLDPSRGVYTVRITLVRG